MQRGLLLQRHGQLGPEAAHHAVMDMQIATLSYNSVALGFDIAVRARLASAELSPLRRRVGIKERQLFGGLRASRSTGGYSLTSDDPAPGSLTVFARCSTTGCLKGSQRVLRPVSEVADMQNRLGLVSRFVDPGFQHRRRHYVGFVRDMVKAGSVWFVETAVEHVGLLFVAKEAAAQRFIIDVCASNRHFSRPPSGLVIAGEGVCLVEFQGALEDAQGWFVGSADIKNAFSSDAHSWLAAGIFLHCPLLWHPKLAAQEERSTRNVLLPTP